MLPAGSYPTPGQPEYNRSYSLAQMNAATAFSYANGAGITVAIIDDGVNGAAQELIGRVGSDSIDLYPSRDRAMGDPYASSSSPNHGTFIADVLAANFNGFGTVGLAYRSTVLSIRADRAGCASTDACFFDTDLASGIDYAISRGARVINLSIGGDTPDGPRFEAALKRAVDAGLVITVAAGNGGDANPDYPARYAVDPRYQGAVIAVGATNAARAIASFSNRAGVAADEFLVAPGADVVTACETSTCWQVSGTSFASPQIAGALALLLQAFPNLTGRQAVDILFRTAADLGANGADPTYGRGLVDLGAAFSPLGALSVEEARGPVELAASLLSAGLGSSALGDALIGAPLATVGYDEYRRQFRVDLGRLFPPGSAPSLAPLTAALPERAETSLPLGGGDLRLSFTRSRVLTDRMAALRPDLDFATSGRAVGLSADLGRVSFTAWRGGRGAPLIGRSAANGFEALVSPDAFVAGGLGFGSWRMEARRAAADSALTGETRPRPGSSYTALGISRAGPNSRIEVSVGHLQEPSGLLGADMPQTSPFLMPGRTSFASASYSIVLTPNLQLAAGASAGIVSAPGRLVSLARGHVTSWQLGLERICATSPCATYRLEVSQPLRLESGRFAATLAAIPSAYGEAAPLLNRTFDAKPSGREIDLRLDLAQDWGDRARAGVTAAAAFQPGSRSDAKPAWGFSAFWRGRF